MNFFNIGITGITSESQFVLQSALIDALLTVMSFETFKDLSGPFSSALVLALL